MIRVYRPAALAWVAIPVAIMALAWQQVVLIPSPGLDPSWGAGLAMAVHNGTAFGSRAIFTYGPLGFLFVPALWYGGLGIASLCYVLVTRVALAAALYLGARRTFGGVAAFVIATIAATATNYAPESVIALIALVLALSAEPGRRDAAIVSGCAGAFAGFELLAKVSIGIALVALTIVFVLSVAGRRTEPALAAATGFVATFLLGWLVTGQDLSALPDYLKNSYQIVSGYSGAMGLSVAGAAWESTAALVGLCIGVWGALHATEQADGRTRAGVVALWVLTWFFAFKEGFVRHDGGHSTIFFQTMLGGFFAFAWRRGHRIAALACAAALLTFVLGAEDQSLTARLHLLRNVRAVASDVRDVVSSSRRTGIIARGRLAIETADPLDAASLALLRGQSVAIYPQEIAIAWAYGLHWDPIPVLQSYSAYTSALDDFDARFLQSSQAPQRILVQTASGVDGRIPSFDQGLTNRTILCRYRALHFTQTVAVLGRSPDRCTSSSVIETVHANWGESVPVPPPPDNHSLVYVRIDGVQVGGFERLRAFFFKPWERFVLLNGAGPFRLVEGTAADGLPLRASGGADYRAPFNMAAGASTIGVLKQGGAPRGGDPITFTFYAQSFDAGGSISTPARLR